MVSLVTTGVQERLAVLALMDYLDRKEMQGCPVYLVTQENQVGWVMTVCLAYLVNLGVMVNLALQAYVGCRVCGALTACLGYLENRAGRERTGHLAYLAYLVRQGWTGCQEKEAWKACLVLPV